MVKIGKSAGRNAYHAAIIIVLEAQRPRINVISALLSKGFFLYFLKCIIFNLWLIYQRMPRSKNTIIAI